MFKFFSGHAVGRGQRAEREVDELGADDDLTDFWLYTRKKSELLKETELKIETLPAVTFCQDCKKTYPTVQYAKKCPHCQSENTFLVVGNEFTIKEIEAMQQKTPGPVFYDPSRCFLFVWAFFREALPRAALAADGEDMAAAGSEV